MVSNAQFVGTKQHESTFPSLLKIWWHEKVCLYVAVEFFFLLPTHGCLVYELICQCI